MSTTSHCPHCENDFQVPKGASEAACPHCQKMIKLPASKAGAADAVDERRKRDDSAQEPAGEEFKRSSVPVDQLFQEEGFEETGFAEDADYLPEGFFSGYQDESSSSGRESTAASNSDKTATAPEREERPAAAPSDSPAAEAYSREGHGGESPFLTDASATGSPRNSTSSSMPRQSPQPGAAGAFDPCRPDEYLRSLSQMNYLDASTRSCVAEALHTYHAGCIKAASVVLGVATERIYLELRQTFISVYGNLKKDASWEQAGKARVFWRQIAQTLYLQLKAGARKFPDRAREFDRLARSLDARVDAFSYLLRFGRDESYRPANFEFVNPGEVHAALALIPHMAELVFQLRYWTHKHLPSVLSVEAEPVNP